ncbi:ABC transporter substrate-binding protein [Natronosalvus vescus]|uniref:ABC transporter substrate-binding protein n=1 Tax=Natronosalvus vescus TaxID=2953881 RepID=UPI0020900174|nr:ABC transporter substrate-binding protein [Natronosalvus vescus]
MTSDKRRLEINKRGVSRRQLLALTTAGVATGLAGCASSPSEGNGVGNGNGNGGNGTSDEVEDTSELSPEDLMDSTVDVMDGNTPEEVNMNRFALNTGYHWIVREYESIFTQAMDEPVWMIYDGDGTYYDPDTRTYHYKVKEDEFYWANGDPITAEDFYTQTMVTLLQQSEDQRWAEEVNLLNEWEWEAVSKDPMNPMVQGYPDERLALAKGREQEWLEKLEDVSTEDERAEVSAEIANERITMQEFIDEGMSSSVWMPVTYDETSVTFEKNENHPYADAFAYDELVAHTCDGAACDELILNDYIDIGTGTFPESIRDVSPDHLQTITETEALASRNLYFRYLNDHIANRWVRRALLTVLDLDFLVNFWQGEGGFVKQTQSGMAEADEQRFLDSDFLDSLYDYPTAGDEELAEEFMHEGGYERNGDGLWENGDGETVEFTFAPPTGSLFSTLASAIYDRWDEFGFEPEMISRDFGYLTPNLQDGTGDVDVTLWATGWGRGDPRDYFSPINPFFLHLYTPGTDDHTQWLDEGLTESPNNGRPIVVEIPEDPSDIFLEGSTREINLLELWDEFISTQDEERSHEIIQDFVTYFNYDLPRPDLFPQVNALWADTESWQFPNDDPLYHDVPDQTQHLVHRYGVMQGREQ